MVNGCTFLFGTCCNKCVKSSNLNKLLMYVVLLSLVALLVSISFHELENSVVFIRS